MKLVISYLTKAVRRGERSEFAGARATGRHVELFDAATLATLERVTMGVRSIIMASV